jgi:hypothetical protein
MTEMDELDRAFEARREEYKKFKEEQRKRNIRMARHYDRTITSQDHERYTESLRSFNAEFSGFIRANLEEVSKRLQLTEGQRMVMNLASTIHAENSDIFKTTLHKQFHNNVAYLALVNATEGGFKRRKNPVSLMYSVIKPNKLEVALTTRIGGYIGKTFQEYVDFTAIPFMPGSTYELRRALNIPAASPETVYDLFYDKAEREYTTTIYFPGEKERNKVTDKFRYVGYLRSPSHGKSFYVFGSNNKNTVWATV